MSLKNFLFAYVFCKPTECPCLLNQFIPAGRVPGRDRFGNGVNIGKRNEVVFPLLHCADDRTVVGCLYDDHARETRNDAGCMKFAIPLEDAAQMSARGCGHNNPIRNVSLHLLHHLKRCQFISLHPDGAIA